MKILAAIPLVYDSPASFLERDVGAVIVALRALGHEATFIALGDKKHEAEDLPLCLTTRAELGDPRWWQAWRPDAIILNTWAAPRYHDIRAAALSAGCPVIEKLDTDGTKSPKVDFAIFLLRELVTFDARGAWWRAVETWLRACARALVIYCLPALLDRRVVRELSQVTMCAAETPIAAARVERYLRLFHANPMPRVVAIPHPAGSEQMRFEPGDVKLDQIVAVGRWDHFAKGWGMLAKVARCFLPLQPRWQFMVVGSGATEEGTRLEREFPGQFRMLGRLDRVQMAAQMKSAKIFLLPSFIESFNIAGAEALCCGASVVGPASIPSSAYFAGHDSGTTSYRRTAVDLTDAVLAEVAEWADGRRDPVEISAYWRGKFSPTAVARHYLEVLGQASKTPRD